MSRKRLVMPDERKFHLTVSGRLDSIMEKGLLPDAKRFFDRRITATPSFGGVYYTKNIFDIPAILRNMARFGFLARNDLVFLSFRTKGRARIDEDDYFRVGMDGRGTELSWIGEGAPPLSLMAAYRRWLGHREEAAFNVLSKEMSAFFDMMAVRIPDPDKGNMLDAVPPGDITVEAVLTPFLDACEKVVWKASAGANRRFFEEVLDALDVHPGQLDNHWPWECALRSLEEMTPRNDTEKTDAALSHL